MQLYMKSFFMLGHTLANTCKDNCPCFWISQTVQMWTMRLHQKASSWRSWQQRNVSLCQAWSPLARGQKKNSLDMVVSPSVALHKHPGTDICNDWWAGSYFTSKTSLPFSWVHTLYHYWIFFILFPTCETIATNISFTMLNKYTMMIEVWYQFCIMEVDLFRI